MSKPFIQRILELSSKSETELAKAAFDEFKWLSLKDSKSQILLDDVKYSLAILAMALNWVDRPRVITRTLSDGVQLRDSIG